MNLRSTLSLLPALLLTAGLASANEELEADLATIRARDEARIAVIDKVSKAFVAIGGGSGIIVSPDGEILTNHHVAGSRPPGSTWTVVRPGGKFQTAKILGTDPRGDITLLKMVKPGPYPYVEFGDSDAIEIGQAVIALGNPFGFSKDGTPNVTTGLISAIHRYQGGYSDAIQTDTAINPGNSGGPLIDFKGRLLGINGRIAVRFGTRANTGIGYAIPTNQIRAFLPHFRRGGVVQHGQANGLRLAETDAGGQGARVRSVRRGTEPSEAGFRPGDLIVEAGGRPVHNPRRFLGIVGTYPAGDSIDVIVMRDGERVTLRLQLGDRGGDSDSDAEQGNGAYLGVRLSSPEGGGAEIEEVVAGSPAAKAGLQTGDVIKSVDGKAIKDVPALIALLRTCRPGQTLTFGIEHNDEVDEVKVTLGTRE